MTELKALIAKPEAASEGSRELDREVCKLVLGRELSDEYDCFSGRMAEEAPHYTTSMDAALTLVPEGWIVAELCQRSRPPVWYWYCALSYLTAKAEPFDIRPDTEAATPALALCIAALKAKSG